MKLFVVCGWGDGFYDFVCAAFESTLKVGKL